MHLPREKQLREALSIFAFLLPFKMPQVVRSYEPLLRRSLVWHVVPLHSACLFMGIAPASCRSDNGCPKEEYCTDLNSTISTHTDGPALHKCVFLHYTKCIHVRTRKYGS